MNGPLWTDSMRQKIHFLKMNLTKTEVMTDLDDDKVIKLSTTSFKGMTSYLAWSQVKTGCRQSDKQFAEMKRRIGQELAAIGKLRQIVKREMSEKCSIHLCFQSSSTEWKFNKSVRK